MLLLHIGFSNSAGGDGGSCNYGVLLAVCKSQIVLGTTCLFSSSNARTFKAQCMFVGLNKVADLLYVWFSFAA